MTSVDKDTKYCYHAKRIGDMIMFNKELIESVENPIKPIAINGGSFGAIGFKSDKVAIKDAERDIMSAFLVEKETSL